MELENERLGLLDVLTDMVNENNRDSINYQLAYYFLGQYRQLNKINIFDAAEENYVSRYSVSRFCQTLGYNNFRDFKKEFEKRAHRYDEYIENFKQEQYRDHLLDEINRLIQKTDQIFSVDEADKFVTRLHESRNIVFLVSGNSINMVKNFQRSMILFGKVVQVISNADNRKELNQLADSDWLIAVSVTGVYEKSIREIAKASAAHTTLITLNQCEEYESYYNEVYLLGDQNFSKEQITYTKYAIDYMFDILISAYARKYD